MTNMHKSAHAATAIPAVSGAQSTQGQGGVWRMVLAMLLSGTIGLAVIESGLPVEQVVLLRCMIGAAGLGLWLVWRHQWVKPTRKHWLYMAWGGLALVANWVALFHAYHYVGIAIATVVYHVQPFMLLIAAGLIGEPVRLRQLPWLLAALAGVVLTSDVGQAFAPSHADFSAWGVVLALLAAALYTVTVMLTKRVNTLAAPQIALVHMVVGGAGLALYTAGSALGGNAVVWGGTLNTPLAQVLVCVLVLGLLHTAWMYGLMYSAFQRLAAPAIAMLSFIYPAVALLVDLLWFGTRPSTLQWWGMAGIALAIAGYRWQEWRKQR